MLWKLECGLELRAVDVAEHAAAEPGLGRGQQDRLRGNPVITAKARRDFAVAENDDVGRGALGLVRTRPILEQPRPAQVREDGPGFVAGADANLSGCRLPPDGHSRAASIHSDSSSHGMFSAASNRLKLRDLLVSSAMFMSGLNR